MKMVTPILTSGLETAIWWRRPVRRHGRNGIQESSKVHSYNTWLICVGTCISVVPWMDNSQLEYHTESNTEFCLNASAQVLNMVNDTASKFAAHPSLTAEATPISAAIGFTAGFALGVRH